MIKDRLDATDRDDQYMSGVFRTLCSLDNSQKRRETRVTRLVNNYLACKVTGIRNPPTFIRPDITVERTRDPIASAP